jgi:hypothetical protein
MKAGSFVNYWGGLHLVEDIEGDQALIRRYHADGRYRPSFWVSVDDLYPLV